MSGSGLVSRAFDLVDFPSRAAQKCIAAFLAFVAIVMPITFKHGLEAYAQHQAANLERQVVAPMLYELARPYANSSVPTHADGRHVRSTGPTRRRKTSGTTG